MPQSPDSYFDRLAQALNRGEEKSGRLGRWLVTAVGIGVSAVNGFIGNDDLLRASALTYTVALSIVPILAIAFSALKGFGAFEQLRPAIERSIAFGSPEITNRLMTYVDRTNATAIGAAGGAFLLLTVISTMSNVEQALNLIFRVPSNRGYLRKFADYLSVMFTVPLLLVAAATLTAMISTRLSMESAYFVKLSPWLLAWAGFFFLYLFFPYTYVSYDAALLGSLAAAVIFQLGQWAYVRFQIGVASYQAIYGALATVPIFLVWIYTAWSIVLFGAEVTAAIQRGGTRVNVLPHAPEFAYVAALHILLRLADDHRRGARPIPAATFASELAVDPHVIEPIMKRLRSQGFAIESGENKSRHHGYLLGRSPSEIYLGDAVGALPARATPGLTKDERISLFLRRMADLHQHFLESTTLDDLASFRLESTAETASADQYTEVGQSEGSQTPSHRTPGS
jgi:membrane protein